MTARAAEVVAVSALAVVLTAALAAPVLIAPSERLFGMATVGRHHDPFTVMEQFGQPIAARTRLQPVTDIPGALLARVSGAVAAYNWLVLLTFPLSAAAAYMLARHLAIAPAAATIAALAFAFSPFHLAHAAYHAHIAQTQWLPLYLLALWRCLDAPTPAAVALLALSVVSVTLSNFYGGMMAAVTTPAAVAAYWYVSSRHRPQPARRLAITLGSLVVTAVAGGAYAWHADRDAITHSVDFGFAREDLFRYSATWWGYLVPPVANPWLGERARQVWDAAGMRTGLLEQQVSLGWGLVALAAVALLAAGRDRRQPSLAAVPILAIVAGTALLCSLAPERVVGAFTIKGPSAILYDVVPMFRSYARFGAIVQLMTVLLAAIGAARLWSVGTRRTRVTCVALLALAAVEYAVWPPAMSRDVLPTTAHRWIVQQSGAVRALDCSPPTPDAASVPWLSGARIALASGGFGDCAEPNVADKLSAAGFTHLLMRRGTAEARAFGRSPLPAGLELAARFPDAEVLSVTAPAPIVYTEYMAGFSPREADATWTWRWMGTTAYWRVVNRSARPVVADVHVEMASFPAVRHVTLILDGTPVQTTVVNVQRGITTIGPLALMPGDHDLVFEPREPPIVAADVLSNGDRRALSLAVGTWHWTAREARP